MTRSGRYLAAGLSVLLLAGCFASGPVSAEWAPPTASAVGAVYADGVTYTDVVEVAAQAGVVVEGRFIRRVASTTAAELFGPDEATGTDDADLLAARRLRPVEVWELRVETTLKGEVGSPEVLMLVEQYDIDVDGMRIDPARVRGNRVVVMVEGRAVDTRPYGSARWMVGQLQLGAGFQIVDDNGAVVMDPWARIPLRGPQRGQADGQDVRQQLGIADR